MANLTGANQWAYVRGDAPGALVMPGLAGYSLSISGTWTGTLYVQRSKDGTTWFDVDSYTANGEFDGDAMTSYYIRCGFKTGATVTGTAVVNLY